MSADMHAYFDSLDSFLTHVTGPDVKAAQYVSKERCEPRWMGTDRDMLPGESSGQCVVRLARHGWPRGGKLIDSVLASADTPRAQNIRRRMVWGDSGDHIDMQRVYAGNLDRAWQGMTKRMGNGPARVRIVVDSLSGGGEDADTMRWRGVAAMRLADTLSAAGYSVQVESGFWSPNCSESGGARTLRVVVKPYTAPCDVEALAATTAMPGFFRALGHAWAGGGMSVRNMPIEAAQDKTDSAFLWLIPQSVKTAEAAGAEVDKCLLALAPDTAAQ